MSRPDDEFIAGLLALADGRSPEFKKRHGYSRNSAKIWLRAGCRCEYCDQSLLEHTMAFYSYEYDHILPASKYKGNPFVAMASNKLWGSRALTDEELNAFALSCQLCNSLKSNYDPNEHDHVYASEAPLDAATRLTLIERVRQRIGETRREYDEMYEKYQGYLSRRTAQ